MRRPRISAVTGAGLVAWLTLAMTHEAEPVELVVPVQLCADAPEPRVKVTDRLLIGAPKAGSSVVRTPESVAEDPLTAVVAPV